MSIETARLAIVGQLQAALTAYPGTKPKVQYENQNMVDPSTQVEPYIDLDIVNISGNQLDLNPAPMAVQYGQIVITAFCKENSGSRAAGLLLDYFLPWFERKDIGIVRTQVGMASKPGAVKGWQGYPITVPFWWTRVVS